MPVLHPGCFRSVEPAASSILFLATSRTRGAVQSGSDHRMVTDPFAIRSCDHPVADSHHPEARSCH